LQAGHRFFMPLNNISSLRGDLLSCSSLLSVALYVSFTFINQRLTLASPSYSMVVVIFTRGFGFTTRDFYHIPISVKVFQNIAVSHIPCSEELNTEIMYWLWPSYLHILISATKIFTCSRVRIFLFPFGLRFPLFHFHESSFYAPFICLYRSICFIRFCNLPVRCLISRCSDFVLYYYSTSSSHHPEGPSWNLPSCVSTLQTFPSQVLFFCAYLIWFVHSDLTVRLFKEHLLPE